MSPETDPLFRSALLRSVDETFGERRVIRIVNCDKVAAETRCLVKANILLSGAIAKSDRFQRSLILSLHEPLLWQIDHTHHR